MGDGDVSVSIVSVRHVILTALYVAAALAITMAAAGVLQEMGMRRNAVSAPDPIEDGPALKLPLPKPRPREPSRQGIFAAPAAISLGAAITPGRLAATDP